MYNQRQHQPAESIFDLEDLIYPPYNRAIINQRATFFPRLPRYYMLYFVHRLNTDMFLDLSIKNTVIIKLLACVIAAFFCWHEKLKQNIICQSNRLTPCVNAKRQLFCYAMNYGYKCLKICSFVDWGILKNVLH